VGRRWRISAVSPPPKKPSGSPAKKGIPPPENDEEARLEQIRALWVQLSRANERSQEYLALVQRIRKETDAFRRLVKARREDTQ
jgi:hypothetical protein